MGMVLCSACSKTIHTSARVCPHCGTAQRGGNTGNNYIRDAATASTSVYAGFWRRFVAVLIDIIILMIGGAIVGGIFGFILGIVMILLGLDVGNIKSTANVMGFVIGIILNWLYYTLLESSPKQATLGKRALGIIVTDLNGNRISFGKANGRYWGKIVSGIIVAIGFIMAGFTQKKQALHDIMAGTLVFKQ